ncbi:MAG: hypothetical protein JWP37_579 [Mucilaginibacter sp.]|nr:hypothetical protein [Mucilaginibacter sp.]
MKTTCLLLAFLISLSLSPQKHVVLTHGTIFGAKPDTTAIVSASKVEAFMGNKTRITIALRGKVIKVTKQRGGWFTLDAGNGKIISAHFTRYNISIPTGLKGKTVIAEGVVQKQFIADDQQHFAGDTISGTKHSNLKTNNKNRLSFEVKGLMIDK